MSSIGKAILCFLCLAFVGCSQSLPDPIPEGSRAPLTRLTYLDGGYDTLASYRGSPVAMMFWAKWCSRSRSALEDYNELAGGYRGGGQGSPVFLAVSIGDEKRADTLEQYLDGNGLNNMRHVFSGNGPDDEAAHAFQVYAVPTFVLIDRNGLVDLVTSDVDELEDALRSS